MKLRRAMRLPALTVGLVSLIIISGCGAQAASANSTAKAKAAAVAKLSKKLGLITNGVLTVAISGEDAPTVTVTPSNANKIGGIDGTLVTDYAKAEGLKLDVISTAFASVILDVETHKVDLGMSYFYTAARAEEVRYTFPFYSGQSVVMTLKSYHWTGLSGLKGDKVGTEAGTVWVPNLESVFGSNLIQYTGTATVGQALINGQITAYVDGAYTDHDPPLTPSLVTEHVLKAGDWGMANDILNIHTYNIAHCDSVALVKSINGYEAKTFTGKFYANVIKQSGATTSAEAKFVSPPQLCTK